MKKSILISALLLVIGFATVRANDGGRISVIPSGQVHNILSSQLPMTLLTAIKNDYKDYWITELYEEGQNKRASYFITVENADQIVKLNSTDSKNWVITNTISKPV
jgi:hypothetical protein